MRSVRLTNVTERPTPEDSAAHATNFPRQLAEYFVSRLARLGPGRLEAEMYWNESSQKVDCRYMAFQETEKMIACVRRESEVVEVIEGQHFRPMLMRLGILLMGEEEVYGSGLFELYFLDAPDRMVGRFQVFICNMREIGFWFRLYFYSRT